MQLMQIQHAGAATPLLLVALKRGMDQKATGRASTDPGPILNQGIVFSSQNMTSFLKDTDAAA